MELEEAVKLLLEIGEEELEHMPPLVRAMREIVKEALKLAEERLGVLAPRQREGGRLEGGRV